MTQIYAGLIDGAGVDTANLVEGVKIVAPGGMSIAWDPALFNASLIYKVALATQATTAQTFFGGDGKLYGSSTGGPLQDGQQVYFKLDGNYVPATVNDGTGPAPLIFDTDLFIYRTLVNQTGVVTGALTVGDPILVTNANITAAAINIANLGVMDPADVDALLTHDSGYGLLETLGHIDFQNPTSGEFFIGSENPGVAPVNSWFAIFGQFFDHGLDLIGKGAQGTKITIALDPSDPLYGTIGPDGQPVTKMVISRASVAGADGNGDPNYVNHTSPFIDQSQTYGSVAQITDLLREWVTTDGTTYHAGMELFDGTTLVDSWDRRWPDGTVEAVHNTLPTLSELRDHVLDTNRVALTWEDVADYRNRSADGTTLSGGNSGHALILDMNTRFDGAHLASTAMVGTQTVADRVADAVTTLDTALADTISNLPGYALNNAARVGGLDTFSQNIDGSLNLHLGEDLYIQMGPGPATLMASGDYGGATAMMLWVNFADFSIMAPPPALPGDPDLHGAVGEILMATVGDHYIAGDGRVNENFGLTSIHHVFHEEHNFQVANLKNWIYQHDTNNSPVDHAGLHDWQDKVSPLVGDTLAVGVSLVVDHYEDAAGNYVYANGTVAWNDNKMFEATKLVVEMEYQHAAVDQYARTITPRIQEFVGYSTGVDSTISLEYSQVAFRFGHSTIRETIDTVDPSGWMLGNVTRYALEKAFLTPQTFAEEGVAAITLGLSRQQMNEVDEFITPSLTQGLLDQPLDLAAINIARSRDLGIPTLNDFREGISLARYTSWDDFGKNMIHPESLVNFIAAYSFGGDVAKAAAIMGLADGTIAEGGSGSSWLYGR